MEMTTLTRSLWLSRQRSGTLRIWIAAAALGVTAFAVYAGDLRGNAPVSSVHVPWWGLAIVFLIVEAYPLHLRFRNEAHSLSLTELALVLGLFMTSPGHLLLAQLCGNAAALVVVRHQRPLKFAFNLAQFAFSSCIALVVFRALVSSGQKLGPEAWIAAFVSAG